MGVHTAAPTTAVVPTMAAAAAPTMAMGAAAADAGVVGVGATEAGADTPLTLPSPPLPLPFLSPLII